MKIVICGSWTRNQLGMNELKEILLARYPHARITVPDDVPHCGTRDPAEKARNRLFYFNEIGAADVVIIYTKDYVGFGTLIELGISYAMSKPIYFTHQIPDAREWDDVRAMLPAKGADAFSGAARILPYSPLDPSLPWILEADE